MPRENPTSISVAHDGAGVAVVWANQRSGAVFDATTWKLVYDGDCLGAAWSSTGTICMNGAF